MLSEWLVDVPADFDTTYLTVPCPVGKRSLVVSARVSVKICSVYCYDVRIGIVVHRSRMYLDRNCLVIDDWEF